MMSSNQRENKRALAGTSGTSAAPNLVRLCQGHANAIAKLGQQIRMSLCNMLLPFLGKFYFARQVRAGKSHSIAPLKAPTWQRTVVAKRASERRVYLTKMAA
jgi:hypothetical protein